MTALFGVRNSSNLPVISQKPKLKSHSILCLGPDILASYVENFLQGCLKLTSLSCTNLKTKFHSLSFHMFVTEDNFSRVNDSDSWPNERLIALF